MIIIFQFYPLLLSQSSLILNWREQGKWGCLIATKCGTDIFLIFSTSRLSEKSYSNTVYIKEELSPHMHCITVTSSVEQCHETSSSFRISSHFYNLGQPINTKNLSCQFPLPQSTYDNDNRCSSPLLSVWPYLHNPHFCSVNLKFCGWIYIKMELVNIDAWKLSIWRNFKNARFCATISLYLFSACRTGMFYQFFNQRILVFSYQGSKLSLFLTNLFFQFSSDDTPYNSLNFLDCFVKGKSIHTKNY